MWPHRFGCILPTVVHGGGPSSQGKIDSPIFCPEYVRFVIKFSELKSAHYWSKLNWEEEFQNYYCKIRCGRDYALFLLLHDFMEQIRVLFGLQFDSDISVLTSGMPAQPALWQHRLPCGRVVVEHEMCGYCGPISLKILWSPPPETEEAIRK